MIERNTTKKYLILGLIASLLVGGVLGVFTVPMVTQWIGDAKVRREYNTLVVDNIDYEFRDLFEGRIPGVQVLYIDVGEKAVGAWITVSGENVTYSRLWYAGFVTMADLYPDKLVYNLIICNIQLAESITVGPTTIVYEVHQFQMLAKGVDNLILAGPTPCMCVYDELIETELFSYRQLDGYPVEQNQLMLREPGFIWPWSK